MATSVPSPVQNVIQIAEVCHGANRAYCQSIGDMSQPEWVDAPEWQKDSAIKGVTMHLETLFAGKEPSPRASHESWLAEKQQAGWKWGREKNPDAKEHPCFVPYDELPYSQRVKDYIFVSIVKAFFAAAHSQA